MLPLAATVNLSVLTAIPPLAFNNPVIVLVLLTPNVPPIVVLPALVTLNLLTAPVLLYTSKLPLASIVALFVPPVWKVSVSSSVPGLLSLVIKVSWSTSFTPPKLPHVPPL